MRIIDCQHELLEYTTGFGFAETTLSRHFLTEGASGSEIKLENEVVVGAEYATKADNVRVLEFQVVDDLERSGQRREAI